jgi:hypothetical protein
MKSPGFRWIASLTRVILCLTLFILANLTVLPSPGVKASSGDDLISLNVQDIPLGDVLDQISESTGYEFIIDASWTSLPVSASLTNVPLHNGLKRILGALNNAIIYSGDGKIRIIIYEKKQSDTAPGSYQRRTPSYPSPVPRRRPYSPPSVTRPAVSEPEESSETEDETTQEETETSEEPDESSETDEEATQEETGSPEESAENDENTGKKQKVKSKAAKGDSSSEEEGEKEDSASEESPEESEQSESTTPDETPKNETDEQSP